MNLSEIFPMKWIFSLALWRSVICVCYLCFDIDHNQNYNSARLIQPNKRAHHPKSSNFRTNIMKPLIFFKKKFAVFYSDIHMCMCNIICTHAESIKNEFSILSKEKNRSIPTTLAIRAHGAYPFTDPLQMPFR